MVQQKIRNFWQDEQGQDIAEYTLIMAFVAIVAAFMLNGVGNVISGIWAQANTQLVRGNLGF